MPIQRGHTVHFVAGAKPGGRPQFGLARALREAGYNDVED